MDLLLIHLNGGLLAVFVKAKAVTSFAGKLKNKDII